MLFKTIQGRTYVHIDAFASLPRETREKIDQASRVAGIADAQRFNVARLESSAEYLALLNYPSFFTDGFPALHESWNVDLANGRVTYRTYQDSLNPPILHRKELMLGEDHPSRNEFEALTMAAEQIGLFDNPTRIGFREQWLKLVREKGYHIVGHQLIPIANDDTIERPGTVPTNGERVARHLTALTRYGFSAPIQALARYGLIDAKVEVFDYGCGRGDDVRGLVSNGISARGWDPHYAPNESKCEADVVNLGFVINVIEDRQERTEALQGAFALARSVLAVSAMLNSQATQLGRPYRDGFLTSRNTFQKYYTQAELGEFIAETLSEEPVPISPGTFFVFRDKYFEQRFRSARFSNATILQRLERSEPVRVRALRPDRAELKYEENREALDALWHTWVRLGRQPDKAEVQHLDTFISSFGSLQRALNFIAGRHDKSLLDRARESRIADLSVYLALSQFARRRQPVRVGRFLSSYRINEG
jgi:hypothetical protein